MHVKEGEPVKQEEHVTQQDPLRENSVIGERQLTGGSYQPPRFRDLVSCLSVPW